MRAFRLLHLSFQCMLVLILTHPPVYYCSSDINPRMSPSKLFTEEKLRRRSPGERHDSQERSQCCQEFSIRTWLRLVPIAFMVSLNTDLTSVFLSKQFIGACKEPVMVIVTELLLGGTLRKYLLKMRPNSLDARTAVGFALDIARAMECLHSHGIIHRDLKPGKLLQLNSFGSLKEITYP